MRAGQVRPAASDPDEAWPGSARLRPAKRAEHGGFGLRSAALLSALTAARANRGEANL